MVTARQKALVTGSWGLIRPLGPQVAELFYDRLFELDPSLEEHFLGDLAVPGEKLMDAIGVAVRGLEDPDGVAPLLRELGRQLEGYGARPAHYATTGKALLWTFEQTLAEDFTPQVKEAWSAMYALVSSTLIGTPDGREAHGSPKASQLSM